MRRLNHKILSPPRFTRGRKKGDLLTRKLPSIKIIVKINIVFLKNIIYTSSKEILKFSVIFLGAEIMPKSFLLSKLSVLALTAVVLHSLAVAAWSNKRGSEEDQESNTAKRARPLTSMLEI